MLEIFKCYNDLYKEIDMLTFQIEVMQKEKEEWWIGGRLFHTVPMDRAAEKVDRLSERIELYTSIVKEKKQALRKLEEELAELTTDEYKIAYKRFVEKKTLDVIADEMMQSIDRVKRLSSKVKKHLATK